MESILFCPAPTQEVSAKLPASGSEGIQARGPVARLNHQRYRVQRGPAQTAGSIRFLGKTIQLAGFSNDRKAALRTSMPRYIEYFPANESRIVR